MANNPKKNKLKWVHFLGWRSLLQAAINDVKIFQYTSWTHILKEYDNNSNILFCSINT